jgi:trehalose-phosphatase
VNDLANVQQSLCEKLVQGGRLWLFLDYDGTLTEFAPTPDIILPNLEIIDLLIRLAKYPDVLKVVIMSGRPFSTIQALLPVPGILEAGTYGVEFQTWLGENVRLLNFETARPFLDQVKKEWAAIIDEQEGFFLEDKGYSLAIHARYAHPAAAKDVLAKADYSARQVIDPDSFRILDGNRFLEVAPLIADKGQSVSTLLNRFPWPGADIVYIGDDDKDEEAFKVVVKNQGIAILVAPVPRETAAQYRLENPQEVRKFLRVLLQALEHQPPEEEASAS